MAEEDQIKRGSGGSSSKKPRQKKAPWRGPGVEKLEQMMLQLRQKNDAAAVASPSILPCPSSQSLNPVNPPHSNQSSSSISFPSVSRAHLSSSNLVTRLPFPTQSVYFETSVPVTLINQTSFVGFTSPRPRITVLGQEDGTRRLNFREYVHRGNFGADPGLPFQSSAFLPYQSNLRTPSIPANSASATMSPPMLSFSPTEPPSNQNMHYRYLTAQHPEIETIRGMKRPYPFSLDIPSGLSLNHKSLVSTPALDESIGSSRNPNFRNRTPHSAWAQNKKKCTENSLSLSVDFHSLASPSANPELRHLDRLNFKLLPFQTSDEVPTPTTPKSEDSASKSSEESLDLELRL